MFKNDNKPSADKMHVFLSLLCFLFIAVGMFFLKTSFLTFMKYMAFQIFHVLLPGMLLYRVIGDKKDINEKVIASYGLGVVLTIVEYFICFSFNMKSLLYYSGMAFSATEAIIYMKNKEYEATKDYFAHGKFNCNLLFLYAVTMLITFITFSLNNPLPNIVDRSTYSQDLLWTIGNTESLLRSFPPVDARIDGFKFVYHYFLSVHLAVITYVTRIDCIELFFYYSQMGKIFLLVCSAYLLGKTCFKSEKKGLAFVFIYLFSNCASFMHSYEHDIGVYLNLNFAHIIYDPFGYELGISFMFLCVTFIIKQFRQEEFNVGYLILSSLFLFAATGSKGPLAIMIIAVLFAMIVISCFQKKLNKNMIVYFVILLIQFGLVYLSLLQRGAGSLDFSLGYMIKDTIIGKYASTFIKYPSRAYLMLIPVHFILFLPFSSAVFIAWFVEKLGDFKNASLIDLLVGGIALCGTVAAYALKQDGHSEVYFIMGSIPFIELCALDWLYENHAKMKLLFKVMLGSAFAISICTTACIVMNVSKQSYHNVKSIVSKSKVERCPDYDSITKYEYEAMKWLRENTEKEDVIASNRYYFNENKTDSTARYFYFSTFSQRQFYLEGWYYNFRKKNQTINHRIEVLNDFYNGKSNSIDVLKKENVKYVVVSHYINNDFIVFNEKLDVVFKNRDVTIIRLN